MTAAPLPAFAREAVRIAYVASVCTYPDCARCEEWQAEVDEAARYIFASVARAKVTVREMWRLVEGMEVAEEAWQRIGVGYWLLVGGEHVRAVLPRPQGQWAVAFTGPAGKSLREAQIDAQRAHLAHALAVCGASGNYFP